MQAYLQSGDEPVRKNDAAHQKPMTGSGSLTTINEYVGTAISLLLRG